MGKRILIAEDDPSTLKLISDKLERAGYVVDKARNGKEALDLIKKNAPSIIISDVIMPVMDGVDLYRELKKLGIVEKMDYIIITDNEVYERSFSILGVNNFIPKPVNVKRLLDMVEKCLENKVNSQELERILILGTDEDIVDAMAGLINKTGRTAAKAFDGIELISFALTLNPKLILIDVLLEGLKSIEIVKALRCFSRLHNVPILLYVYFKPENLNDVDGVEKIKDYKDECLSAGATKYIGRFAQTTFLSNVTPFL